MSTRVVEVTEGSCLFDLVWFLIYTGPSLAQDRMEDSEVDFQLYLNSLSWRGVLADVQSSDLTKWCASGRTFSQ